MTEWTRFPIRLFELAWQLLAEMAPYLLLGFFVSGLLSVFLSPAWIRKHLGGRGFGAVVKAALFGVPLPLCSCGVVPVAASLRKNGAGKPAVVSFLLSTPQTGVDSILATAGLMGWAFALFRPLVALLTGLFGGGLVAAFEHEESAADPNVADDGETAGPWRERLVRSLRYGFVDLPRDLARPMFAGLAVAGLISVLLPDENTLPQWIGQGFGAKLAMLLVGIPMYVCSTGSIPVAAALMAKGLTPGAALVFLISGPATNAATLTIVWRVLGRRTAFLYLLTIALGALAAGSLFDSLAPPVVTALGHHHHGGAIWWEWTKHVSAAALLLLLLLSLRRPAARVELAEKSEGDAMNGDETTLTLTIDGMTCGHCAAAVRRALAAVPGVTDATVDLAGKKAVVAGSRLDPAVLKTAVEDLGYTVLSVV